jgi:hypothetical protein
MNNGKMMKIGSVWKSTKEDGSVYYSGNIDVPCPITLSDDNRILIFKNRSEHEKSPALDILISKGLPQKKASSPPADDGDVPF